MSRNPLSCAALPFLLVACDLYTKGLADYHRVLDSERALLRVQDQNADSRGNVTGNLVRLYKALGGGWWNEVPEADLGVDEKKKEPAKSP